MTNSTAPETAAPKSRPSAVGGVTRFFVGAAIVSLLFADIAVTTVGPWTEFGRMAKGFVTPDFGATENLASALLQTITFALLGVVLANIAGFGLMLIFRFRAVRVFCAVIRAVHELFWALIFAQIFGLTPLTGMLAIGIPYAGIIAKVYAEIIEEADVAPLQALPYGASRLSAYLFVKVPDVWRHFASYSLYRMECGLRSSAVLGFIGLPTLGFHLETAFRQGRYSEAAALLILFYFVIATIRLWLHRHLVPLYLIAALIALSWRVEVSGANMLRFLTTDIVPHPLRSVGEAGTLMDWLDLVLIHQGMPGLVATIQLGLISFVLTGLIALASFPLISPLFAGRWLRPLGHLVLVVVRSTPEYVFAYVLLQLWGPSMLPAIVALSVHNGAIIAHLVGRHTESITLRADVVRGLNRYAFEALPRVYRPMLALLFYRFEIIMRETAILGILGVATLGFYIDNAFSELRHDRALMLIGIAALLNIAVDGLSRRIRASLRLKTTLAVR